MQNNLRGAISSAGEVIVGGIGVRVKGVFGGPAVGFSVSAIVDHEERRSGGCYLSKVIVPIGDVAGVAVEVERDEARTGLVNLPAVNANAV